MARNRKETENRSLKAKSSVGDAVRHGVAMSDATLARLRPEAAAQDAATIHHFRTTLRRLRSLLSSFKEVAPPAKRKALSGRLKDLSQRYAALREWDVLIQALAKDVDGADPDQIGAVAKAARERRQTIARADGPLTRDIAATDHALAAAEWLRAPSGGETELWNERIDDYAPDLLERQWRKLRKRSRTLDLSDAESFHKFRIAAKKHRYTIEFLASRYPKKQLKPYLKRVVAIQDVLGEMRDALVAEELIGQLELPPALRATATKWLARRAAECRKRFPAQGKAFRRETPFWEH
ncbi:MAG TPA: CHAD domain-containing protein [Stellaceae bacterium]|jgi:CHAD domain-containing protein|nr:CHAD domain-containing protein [Stellaceae bacterium]